MKKILTIALSIFLLAALSACGSKDPEVKPTEVPTMEPTTPEVTEPETEGPITEGTLNLLDLVEVSLTDGWYAAKAEEGEVQLENDDISGFMARVNVKVQKIYTPTEGAEVWAGKIQGNYGGKGTITQETINNALYYHLSGVVDDNKQNMFFTDLNEKYYLEVDVMFMNLEDGMSVFDHTTI